MSEGSPGVSPVIRFDPFDADLQTQELRKHGVRIRLPGQSFQILRMLLDRPGSLVTRDELQKALWPTDTFVDFDHSLNAAVKRLREALGDSADEPKLVETLPRRGYRFIGTITPPIKATEPPNVLPAANVTAAAETLLAEGSRWTSSKIAAVLLAGLLGTVLVAFVTQRWRHAAKFAAPAAVPFTALSGEAGHPAFSPDGSQIAFQWTGDIATGSRSVDLYLKTIGRENLIRLTNHPSNWLTPAWSPDGSQIAFHRLSKDESGIYIVPALGGPERKLRSTHAAWGVGMVMCPRLFGGSDLCLTGRWDRPTTSSMPWEHAPRCATGPRLKAKPTPAKSGSASAEFIFAAGIPRRRATLHPRRQD
jgi:DNA-binding winged helix-turn-helix (wHTH) protein